MEGHLGLRGAIQVTYFSFFRETKLQNPERIVLVRSGEYYVAVGIDAVMLMKFGDMSPVGADGVARVRCSPENLPYYLHRIVQQCGFEVVICEESDQLNRIGKNRNYRRHYVAAIIDGTRTSSYVHALKDGDLVQMDEAQDRSNPLAAVWWSQTGFSLLQYDAKENAMRITSRLSEEGLWAKLNSTGMTPPLYVHISSLPGAKIDTDFRGWQKRAEQIAKSVFGSVDRYQAEDPVAGFQQLMLQKNLQVDVDRCVILTDDVKERTSPPPLSTVSELGICPREHSGVLPLMEYVLPERCQKLVMSWMRRCIMDPPSPEMAMHIHQLCQELTQTACSIPQLNARLAPNRIVEVGPRQSSH